MALDSAKFSEHTKSTSDKRENKLDFIRTKNICAVNDITKKRKRQRTEWENTFANLVSDDGLVSRMCIKNSYDSTIIR